MCGCDKCVSDNVNMLSVNKGGNKKRWDSVCVLITIKIGGWVIMLYGWKLLITALFQFKGK